MAVARYLVDKSALGHLHRPAVQQRIATLLTAGLVATCGIIDLEVLYSARSAEEYRQVAGNRRGAYEWLPTEDEDFRRALEVQGELAGRGQLRAVPLPDLLIAATAERHRVTVLHCDHAFDLVAEVTRQPVEWAAHPDRLT
jgi:predicted nucleic acid-binding protein